MKHIKPMHPYIPFLLEDIAAAHPSAGDMEEEEHVPKTFEEEMEEMERYIAEDPPHTLSYYCGLKPEDFPPAEQLSDNDMRRVFKAFEKMLFEWRLSIDLPENIPPAFAYKLMVDTLSRKTFIPKSGFCGFDYCTGYAPDCELKEYCPCLKIWNEK